MSIKLARLVREPNSNRDGAPTLVLLHGLGSNEEDLMGLAPELDPGLRIVALRAPFTYGMGGFAWFSIAWELTGIKIDPEQVVRSRDLLLDEMEALRAEFEPRKLVLGGFSQGAMMSLAAGLLQPELFDGLMLLSGRNVSELFSDASPGMAGMRCLVQHGTRDEMLPVSGARATRDSLVALGANVEYHEYPMGHEISLASLRDARLWLEHVVEG